MHAKEGSPAPGARCGSAARVSHGAATQTLLRQLPRRLLPGQSPRPLRMLEGLPPRPLARWSAAIPQYSVYMSLDLDFGKAFAHFEAFPGKGMRFWPRGGMGAAQHDMG